MIPLSYERYLDQILGGWIGKSMGGTVGARFEGYKGWIEISPEEMFPPEIPPNDDLDLQVLWLKVLEEKGAALTSDDLAQAWLEGCWYPFNEYGIFRRNWRLHIPPPMSGRFTNQFWETGMGCPIRSEIWGYVFPGAPDLAAKYARIDGILDHTEQSVGAEMMLAAMASMAFFVPDVRRLAEMFIDYLPKGTPIEQLTRAAFQSHAEGLSLRDARDRLMALAGVPETSDAQTNVPFAFLGLLYGNNDLQATLLAALQCGYDTDSTMATAGALVGQILGASGIAQALKARIGDELVMGIEYRRPEMTLSALARDTARIGVLLSRQNNPAVQFSDAPQLEPLPPAAIQTAPRLSVEYVDLPTAAPGDSVRVNIHVDGSVPNGTRLHVGGPDHWTVVPASTVLSATERTVAVTLHAPSSADEWPMQNLFTARLESDPPVSYSFGVAGAGLWQFLGVYFDPLPDQKNEKQVRRRLYQHFVSLERQYLPEPSPPVAELYQAWSLKLGRPALVPSYQHEVDPARLIGLRGPYCCYLARTIISPDDRTAYAMVGNTDGFRLYLNGTLVGEEDESIWWSPFNNAIPVELRKGRNELLVKLLKRDDDLKFTLGFRADTGVHGKRHNVEDWVIDLVDVVPT